MNHAPRRGARDRRGLALLAALWLVVMITSAGLQFALVARERRALGLTAADRGRETAALEGALARVQAQLEWDAAQSMTASRRRSAPPRSLRAGDLWSDLASRFSAPVTVGELEVAVHPVDLGTVVNVNLAGETELATLFAAVIADETRATQLARAILDWRDEDDDTRAGGAEREQYQRAGAPIRPANGAFRSLDDLQDVLGMTPVILAAIRPYLTVDGAVRRINVNAAPAPVLRTLPGMTEPLLATILALRSRARRVESVPALLSAVQNAGRSMGGAGSGERQAAARALADAVTVEVTDVALELTATGTGSPHPARLVAVVHRNADGTTQVQGRRW